MIWHTFKYCLRRLIPVIILGLSLQVTVFAQDDRHNGIPFMPQPRVGMCSARIGNTVYFIGGAQSLQGRNLPDVTGTSTVQSFNFDTMTWDTSLAPLETPRVFACAVAVQDSIYVMGGVDNHGYVLNSVEVYDPSTNTWHYGPSMHFERKGAAAAVFGGHILVFGGGDSLNILHRQVEEYNPQLGSWKVLDHETGIGRAFHHVATVGNSIYIFGGLAPIIGPVPVIERYIPGEGVVSFKLLNPWTTPRAFFGSVRMNDSVFVISGYGNQSNETGYYNDVDIFDFASPDSGVKETILSSAVQTARRGFVAALGPSGEIYLFGGIRPGGTWPIPWVTTLGITPTNVSVINLDRSSVPSGFKLYQNFPNPFNPTTVISFNVPSPGSRVDLRIYNLLGQQVETLVNGYLSPGTHSVTFDGGNLTSGAYIYRLETKNGSIYRKMVLIK